MADSNDPSTWTNLVEQMSTGFDSMTDKVIDNLHELLEQSRKLVNCAEAAIMVPAEDPSFLKFLVSVNSKPGVADIVTQMTIPCDESIVGCVYKSGQLMAVANPEDFYQKVDEKTGLKTSIYLVTPILDDDDILGVMTFVNRPDDSQELFNEQEIHASGRLSELAASGLRYYSRLTLQQKLFDAELASVAEHFHLTDPSRQAFSQSTFETQEQSPLARAILMLERLSPDNQELAAELISVIQAHIGDEM